MSVLHSTWPQGINNGEGLPKNGLNEGGEGKEHARSQVMNAWLLGTDWLGTPSPPMTQVWLSPHSLVLLMRSHYVSHWRDAGLTLLNLIHFYNFLPGLGLSVQFLPDASNKQLLHT